MRHLIFSSLLALAFAAAGCGFDGNCPDCGCGIGGPTQNPGQDIDVLGPGVAEGGIAAVDLLLEEGMCVGVDREHFRVSYDAGAVTVIPAGGLAKLDATKVTSQDQTSTWSDRDLVMSFARSGTTLVLAFTSAGKSVKVACNGANRAITCPKI